MIERPIVDLDTDGQKKEKTPFVEGLRKKIENYSKYFTLVAALNSTFSTVASSDEIVKTSENIVAKSELAEQFLAITSKHDVTYLPQIDFNDRPVLVNIAQIHAGHEELPEGIEVNIEETAERQKKIERIVLDLIEYSKETGLSVSFFDEGNITGDDLYRDSIEMGNHLADLFLQGDKDLYNSNFDNMIERMHAHFGVKEALKYGLCLRILQYLEGNTKTANSELRDELKKDVESRLKQINMNYVYYAGALPKMVWDGTIKLNQFKICEKEELLNEDYEVIYGEKSEFANRSKKSFSDLQKEFVRLAENPRNPRYKELFYLLAKMKEPMEQRENATVEFVINDISHNKTDIAVVVYGAAHDFRNNVEESNSNNSIKIGLVRIDASGINYPLNKK